MKQSFIFFLILACSVFTKSFANTSPNTTDSLLKVVSELPADSSRLETLYALVYQDQLSSSSPIYLGELLKEAIKQDNKYYQCLALYAYVIYYFNHQDEENTVNWMKKLSETALKHKYHNLYFAGKRAEITISIIKRKIEYGITEAEKAYKLAQKLNNIAGMSYAKLCLMIAYTASARYKEGLEAGLEAYNLLPSTASLETRLNIIQEVTLSCASIQNKALPKYLKEYRHILEELSKKSSNAASYKSNYLLMESIYAGYYLNEGNMNEARHHLKEMDKYFSPTDFIPNRGLYFDVYAQYYRMTQDYDKALVCADSAISLLSEVSDNGGLNYRIKRASILADANRFGEAIPLFQELLAKKDSFYRNLSTSQMDEIHQMRNLDLLLLEKEQHKTLIHYIIIALIVIALLILIPSTIRIYCVRKRLKKEEEKIRQMTQIAEEANEVKSRFLANMSYNIRTSLNNVLGFSQLMTTEAGETDAAQWQKYSEIVQSNSAQLIQLVNDVLDLSRLEAGKTKWQIQDYDIIPFCSDIISLAQMRSENKVRINLHTEIESQPFRVDIARFTQVVLSMLIHTDPYQETEDISFFLHRDEEKELLVFRIVNSPLAKRKLQNQQTEVRHSINRLTIANFGGTYTIASAAPDGPAMLFTYSYRTR